MEANKKKSLLYLGMTLLFLITIIGVTYAAFSFTGTGTKENVITTGSITVSFEEQNNILIKDRYPESDAEGLANIDENSSMSFTVSGDAAGGMANYAVGITEINQGQHLTQDYIKINLVKNGSPANGFTSDTGKTIGSFKLIQVKGYLSSHVIAQGTITGVQVDTYNLKAWIDESYDLPMTQTSNNGNHGVTTKKESFSFKIKVVATDTNLETSEKEPNIPNAPELATNMIPVTYNGTNWVKADSTNENNSWYDYDNKVWANAVTVTSTNRDTYLKAKTGTPIAMDDINTMWVWIPRFNATTNTLDCSTLINPTVEKYPQCYQNLSDTDKMKVIAAMQQLGFTDPEKVVNDLLNGELVEFNGDYGGLQDAVNVYNNIAAPDSISIDYSTFISDRVVTGANGGTQAVPGAFNIDFVTTNETAHEAFIFGEKELNGFWIGKFETGHSSLESSSSTSNNLACINDLCENAKGLRILPNIKPLTDQNVSNFFYAGRSMEQSGNDYGLTSSEVDTHMIKNPEWGAVAYLSQSIYGRCTSKIDCKEIGVSNYMLTGHGAPAGSSGFSNNSNYVASQPYNTEQGMDASTTGNIYGVYDMSGGAMEYVMGVYTDGSKIWSSSYTDRTSGFNGCIGFECTSEILDELPFPETKYYNTYTTETNYFNSELQHAMVETYFWYNELAEFVSYENPWFTRGGAALGSEISGIFSYMSAPGVAAAVSLRAVLVK